MLIPWDRPSRQYMRTSFFSRRDRHSEAKWRAVFQPSDEADMERFAELIGPPKEWEPVLRGLDNDAHQFVLRNSSTKDEYITWIDEDLHPLPSQAEQKPRGSQPYGQ